MWWVWASAVVVLASTASAVAVEPTDRLDRFREAASQYAEATDPDADSTLLSRLFELADEEVRDNLASGPPFSSPAFIQERLNAFSDAWGGAAFKVVKPSRASHAVALLGLVTVTRGDPRGSLRFYGRSFGEREPLAAATHEGIVEAREWPDAAHVLASWSGVEAGRGSRPLHLELWRLLPGAAPARVWNSGDAFPDGLRAIGFVTRKDQLVVRYEVRYPGWKAGCADQTEHEDVFRLATRDSGLTLARRRVVNGWHRELQSAVTRLFEALGGDDRRAIALIVPDPLLRARVPRDLRAEPICDERDPARRGTVVVAATRAHDQQRVPWSLAWQRGPRGWRVTGAGPVLQ